MLKVKTGEVKIEEESERLERERKERYFERLILILKTFYQV